MKKGAKQPSQTFCLLCSQNSGNKTFDLELMSQNACLCASMPCFLKFAISSNPTSLSILQLSKSLIFKTGNSLLSQTFPCLELFFSNSESYLFLMANPMVQIKHFVWASEALATKLAMLNICYCTQMIFVIHHFEHKNGKSWLNFSSPSTIFLVFPLLRVNDTTVRIKPGILD